MEKAVFTSSPSIYNTINALTLLASRMAEEDVEYALQWVRVGLAVRQILTYCVRTPEGSKLRQEHEEEQDALELSEGQEVLS